MSLLTTVLAQTFRVPTLLLATVLLATLPTLLVATPTSAQDIPPGSNAPPEVDLGREAEARTLFQAALRHIENEEMAEAVGALGRSLELVPRVSTALNLALALESIGDVIEALSLLGEIESGRYGEVDERVNVGAEIERASLLVGTAHLVVTSSAEGQVGEVVITVDGAVSATLRELGATSFSINPGSHVVSASALDHEAARTVVDVESGGRVELSLNMRQLRDTRPGTLTVDSLPDARIEIAGYGSGVGSLRLELEPREYRVVVIGPRGIDESLVEIAPGRAIRLYLEPPTRSAWQNPWLWTAVGVVVAGAAVAIGWRISQTQRAPIENEIFGNIEALRRP